MHFIENKSLLIAGVNSSTLIIWNNKKMDYNVMPAYYIKSYTATELHYLTKVSNELVTFILNKYHYGVFNNVKL